MKTIEQLSEYLETKQIEHNVEEHGFSAEAYSYAQAERKLKFIKSITPGGFVAAIEKEIRQEAGFVKKTMVYMPEKQMVKQWISSSLSILVYLELIEWMKSEEKELAPHE